MWKGKARDDNYGSGGAAGVVLPLDMHVNSPYENLYTLPLQVGNPPQTLSVQIDTGSSDLWIAANSCSSQACKQTSGKLYDPSGSKQTGQPFSIQYVEGVVSGPIVWDTVTVGGYEIDSQALAAASSVDSEPLSPYFSGIMGLALPLNSVIASEVPPTTSNAPDGAIWPSNLFSMTPSLTAPSYRFLSLTLARPDGGHTVPSLLGIGRHPPEDVVKDPSQVEYASLASPPSAAAGTGPFFWQARLNKVTVYEDGVRKEVDLNKGSTAVVDSGMPIILASEKIANGIYGAIGIGPGSDGQYYVPCTTPLNMTLTLDSRNEIPLHPLDLTFWGSSLSRRAAPRDVSGGVSNSCLGLIQSFPPSSTLSGIADIILGVPFMRSVYTVMAYDPPDSDGIFPNSSSGMSQILRPRLGLLGLIDHETALSEFHQERVQNQPLTTQAGNNNNNNNNNGGAGSGFGTGRTESSGHGNHKLSVGVEVLLGLIGFFLLCFVIFGGRWAWQRRKIARERRENEARGLYTGANGEDDEKGRETYMMQEAAFILARKGSRSSRYATAEDTLRSQKFQEYMKRRESEYTDDTARTRVTDDADTLGKGKNVTSDSDDPEHAQQDISLQDREFGVRPMSGRRHPVFSYHSADGEDTLVDSRPRSFHVGQDAEERRSLISEYPPSPTHTRMSTAIQSPEDADFAVAVPLLAHTRSDSQTDGPTYPPSPYSPDYPHVPMERTPLGMGRPTSRARVGSIARDSPLRQSSSSNYSVQGRSVSGPRPMSDRRSSSGSVTSVRHASGPATLSSPPLPTIPAIPPPPSLPAASANSSTTGLSGDSTVGHNS